MDKQLKNHLWFPMLALFLMSFLSYSSGQEEGCRYLIRTQTADVEGAGSSGGKVRISLCTSSDTCFLVLPDLAQYGERGPLYEHYFSQGRYSYFSLSTRASCSVACTIMAGHDGGRDANWLVDFIEVEALTTSGFSQYNTVFPIFGWLNTSQQITVNRCLKDSGHNYEVWVKTGDRENASTYGNVKLSLCDYNECFLDVPNLAQYGVKGPFATDYFTRRSVSLFIIPTDFETFRYPCKISVSHNGETWFLDQMALDVYEGSNYVYGRRILFQVWLDTDQFFSRDLCNQQQDIA